MTPHLLQRFYGNDRGRVLLAPGTCLSCHSRAHPLHLMWSCPKCAALRQRALTSIGCAPVPPPPHAWACPDTIIPAEHAPELWRGLVMFLRDPMAPPLGDWVLATTRRSRPTPHSPSRTTAA
ncbi:hypothetical protein HPB47_026739 [Ixodes persulcatus]|uniref:Uncharacterized protein n=1 Tax=Ixodes persulcatus TaxID=34615 RepID=A0AC60PZ27_IXOPE|nr:hypothetical protein HPB47_026739 [Ixodes persulcatus]